MLVVAASNRPADLDEAVRRRLTKRFYVPLPDAEVHHIHLKISFFIVIYLTSELLIMFQGRHQIFRAVLSKVPSTVSEEELMAIATKAEGYSGADIQKICKEAAMYPIRECPNILELNADEVNVLLEFLIF